MGNHAATLRLHRHRARAREGKAVLLVEVCLADMIELLIGAGLLQEWDSDDKSKVEAATGRLLAALAEESAG
jgi:hypothetical protein